MAEPTGWNIVILGAWNVAILTPDGIRRRLLELPEGTPIEVEVSIDRPGQFRILHDNLVIVPLPNRLEVAPQILNLDSLAKAVRVGQKALTVLPETPVAAAGLNIRYKLSPAPEELVDLVRAPIDDLLSDARFEIGDRHMKREIMLTPGAVNVEFHITGTVEGDITFNFHRAATRPQELAEWLGRYSEFSTLSNELARVFHLQLA